MATPRRRGGRARRRTAGRERGFTFIELLVALAILAFAFAYGVVHLDGATAGTRLSSAARQLGSRIDFLRGSAIHSGLPMEMEIDLTGVEIDGVRRHRFRCTRLPRGADMADRPRDAETVVHTEWTYLPKWIRIAGVRTSAREAENSGTFVVRFDTKGEIVPNGFLVRMESDEIADRDASVFCVEVNGITGEIAYVPGEAEFDQVVPGDSFR